MKTVLLYVLVIIGVAGSKTVSQIPPVIPSAYSRGYIATHNSISNLKCDGSTNDSAALAALLTAIGSTQASILFPSRCLLSTVSIPASVTIDATSGGGIKVESGQKVTVLGPIIPTLRQIFFNALPGQGTIDFTGGTALDKVYPEWWGAVAGGNSSTNTYAIQAAIYGAFGCGPDACRTNVSGNAKYNRELHFNGMYDINGELQLYHVNGFVLSGENKVLSGIRQNAVNSRIFDGQSVTYGYVSNLRFDTKVSQNVPLVDIDYSGAQGPDLKSQNITFQDVFFSGNGTGYIGLLIDKSGSSAQGDNIRCLYCYGSGFRQAAIQAGSSGSFAQNAMLLDIHGGDFQGNPQFAIAIYGGSANIDSVSMENGLLTQTGFDILCQATQYPCVLQDVRSESLHLVAGSSIRVRNSETLWQATQWDAANLAGTSGALNQLVSGSQYSGVGAYYYVTIAGTWGGLNTTNATSGSATTIVCSGCSWTPSALVGMRATIVKGSGFGESAVITSNTGTTITVPAWTTPFAKNWRYYASGVAPDNTSQFVVEPNWGTQTTSGTVTFAAVPGFAIAGDLSGGVPTSAVDATLEDVVIAGLPIWGEGNFKNLIVSRTDWMAAPPYRLDDSWTRNSYENILALMPCPCLPYIWGPPMAWSFPRNGLLGFRGFSQVNLNAAAVWSVGAPGGGQGANDVWIGGRSDPNSSNDPTRAILEYGGLLGPPTPNGTNQNAGTAGVSCGLSTGSGTPGICNWYLGATGLPGSQVNRSSIGMSLSITGLQLGVHLNQNASGNYGGSCTMSSSTSCTFSLDTSYTNPVCIATVQSVSVIAGGCSVSGTTVTITAASPNSSTWGALVFGNPN